MRIPRGLLGWIVAAAILVIGAVAIGAASSFSSPELRSEHAQAASGAPSDLIVTVSADGKTFHVPGCVFIHNKEKSRTLAAADATREGYAPCVRCMKKLTTDSQMR